MATRNHGRRSVRYRRTPATIEEFSGKVVALSYGDTITTLKDRKRLILDRKGHKQYMSTRSRKRRTKAKINDGKKGNVKNIPPNNEPSDMGEARNPDLTGDITDENPGGVPRETWVSLAESAFASFKDRRALEWKLAFGFWTAIVVFTKACIDVPGPKVPEHLPTTLGGVYMLLFLTATFCFLFPVQRAHFDDKAWWKYYLRMAQWNRGESLPSEPIDGENMRLPATEWFWELIRIWSWYCGQLIFTAVFLFLSWYTITTIHSTKKATDDTSTQTLRIIEELLKRVPAAKVDEVAIGSKNSNDSSIPNLSMPDPAPTAGNNSSKLPDEDGSPSDTDRTPSDVHSGNEK